jgi:transposase
MANPYPVELRERAVRAYESSDDTYVEVATRFTLHVNTLVRWVQQSRETGSVAPKDKGGGWYSPVDGPLLTRLVQAHPDWTTDELTRAYNRAATLTARVHRSSILRALYRDGYVFKKTIATGGTGSCDGPSRAPGVPALGPADRPASAGVSR